MSNAKKIIEDLLLEADIHINGQNPWDLQVHNEKFYSKLLYNTELALGETYTDGWWDCRHLDQFFYRALRANLDKNVTMDSSFFINNIKTFLRNSVAYAINLQTKFRSVEVGKKHYDTGNDLFKIMLDKRMIYTCAFWENVSNLDEAQERKLEITCKKLQLQPGMKVLDIGCGWGGLAKYIAEHYNVSVVGVTISEQQYEVAKAQTQGYPIEILLQDYRELLKNNIKFDRVVSLGMFEHVGHKNYPIYMQVVNHCLKDDGLFLLHTIGSNKTTNVTNKWIEKYIFPNSHLPSIAQIGTSIEELFVMEDWQNYGAHYDKTLMAWHQNFNDNFNKNVNNIELSKKYDARFRRLWNFYLLSCAGAFRARRNQLWQIVLTKKGWEGGYKRLV